MSKRAKPTKRGVLDPNGKLYFIKNRKTVEFAQAHGLNATSLYDLLNGRRSTLFGWISLAHKAKAKKIAQSKMYLINTRTNEIIKKTYKEKDLCPIIGLNRDCLNKLIRGVYLSAKGWMLLEQYELIYGKLDQDTLCKAGVCEAS